MFATPFEVLLQTLTVPPRGSNAWEAASKALGPKVPVRAAHLRPQGEEAALGVLFGTNGLTPAQIQAVAEDKSLLVSSWSTAVQTNLSVEFELADSASLSAMEIWNYNVTLATTNGVRQLDVAVSADGQTWQTLARGLQLPEAPGTAKYRTPTVLKLQGVTARYVRLENLVPFAGSSQMGLHRVLFHSVAEVSNAAGAAPAPAK